MKFHSDKARLENLSGEECLVEVYPVFELASSLFFLVLLHCPVWLGLFRGLILSKVAVYIRCCARRGRRDHLPSAPKKCRDQLAPGAELLPPLSPPPMDLTHGGVSCQPSTLTLYECYDMKVHVVPRRPTGEPRTWKDFRAFSKQCRPASLCPCMGMKADLCRPAVLAAPRGSQIQQWKLSHESKSTGLLLPLTARAALSVHYWDLHSITEQN